MLAGEMSLEAAKSRLDSGLPARPGSYSGTVSIPTFPYSGPAWHTLAQFCHTLP